MSDFAALKRQILSDREVWVDVAPGKAVKFRRPPDSEGASVLAQAREKRLKPHLFIDELVLYAVDWRGFSEADLLGKGIGNNDPLPFDSEVWRLAVADNLEWFGSSVAGLLEAISERLFKADAARGNSSATSTPSTPAPTVAAAP